MNFKLRKIFFISWIGGLTFLAGATNISGIILFGKAVSHHTGNVSNAAIALGNGNIKLFGSFLSIILLFFLGSIISGFLFREQNINKVKSFYSLLPILFGVILLITFYIGRNNIIIFSIYALYMGIQNAFCLKIKGIPIRITHISGYLTDTAVSLSSVLQGRKEEAWKVYFYLLSLLCFFIGGTISVIVIKLIGEYTIVALALSYITIGLYSMIGFVTNSDREISEVLLS